MSLLKKLSIIAGLGILLLSIAGCHSKAAEPTNVIKVGTIAGPETEIMQVAKEVAKTEYGLDIEIVTFTDYDQPNEALNDGSIDANVFQHLPYLQQSVAAHDYKITPIARTFIYPMGIYSKRYQTLGQLSKGSIVAIPDDPSNEARALLLLQQAKLIKLENGGNALSTPMDIVSNPFNLKIKSLDAAQLPRVLPDVGIAIINTTYAVPAGLYPNRDALFTEDKNSIYANLVVVRMGDQNKVNEKHLVDALHSPQVLEATQKFFKGQAIPAW
ncbi:MAG: MetQ/NlpA family ABC transporter substrate-binding protein [Gammaproteobacteria bacterium]